eukprot:3305372-Rhodomonas_salina.1
MRQQHGAASSPSLSFALSSSPPPPLSSSSSSSTTTTTTTTTTSSSSSPGPPPPPQLRQPIPTHVKVRGLQASTCGRGVEGSDRGVQGQQRSPPLTPRAPTLTPASLRAPGGTRSKIGGRILVQTRGSVS